MKFKTNLRIKSGIIDPVPFVNVILILVVYFVLSAHFRGTAGLILDLPSIEQTELYNIKSVEVSLSDNKLFLDNTEISLTSLKDELYKKSPQLLAIKADKDIQHSQVSEIIGIAKSVGIKQIAIAADNSKR